jgi:hypothetical protein
MYLRYEEVDLQSRFLNFQSACDSETGMAFNSADLAEEKFWNSTGKSSRNFAKEMGSCNPTLLVRGLRDAIFSSP